MRLLLVTILSCIMPAGAVYAQAEIPTLSQEEIAERFQRQKTRGLVIAPASQGEAQQPKTGAALEYSEVEEGDAVNIKIVFDFDSAALRPDQKPQLVSMCGAMKHVDVQVFRIIGHTDAAGSDEYNERLSRLRADEVKRHLVSKCGIAAERLEAVGMGKRSLYDPQNPRAGVNRRVEFQVGS